MDPGHTKTMSTKAGLFNFNEHTDLLGILLRCRFCFRRSGVGPKSLRFWQVPPSSCSPGMAEACSSGEGPDASHTCPNRQRAASEGHQDADGTWRTPRSFLHPRPSCASRIAPHHDPLRPSFLSLFADGTTEAPVNSAILLSHTCGKELGWVPATCLSEGLTRT